MDSREITSRVAFASVTLGAVGRGRPRALRRPLAGPHRGPNLAAAAAGRSGPAGDFAHAAPVPIAAQRAANLLGAPLPLRVLLVEHVLLEVSALELAAERLALRNRVQRGSVAPRNSTAPLAATLRARVGYA